MNKTDSTKGNYITFHRARKQNPKTSIYLVRTRNSTGLGILLGTIKWYAHWRQYGFYPEEGTVFEKTCLDDIHNFIIKLNRNYHKKRSKK